MNNLHKIMIIGAGFGLSQQLAEMLPEIKPERAISMQGAARLMAAEQKRQDRAERNRKVGGKP